MNSLLLLAAIAAGSAQSPAAERESLAHPVGPVTGAYLRTQAPELVAGMAEEVRAGRMDRALFESVAGKKTAAALLEADAAKFALPQSKLRMRQATWATTIGGRAALRRLIDFSPAKLTYPKLKEGEHSEKTLMLTCPADGSVSAELATNLNFRIVRMSLYDGTLVKSLDPGVPDRPRVVAYRTLAPWNLPVKSGQTVGITVRFEPKFHLIKNGAGPKTAVLELSGTNRIGAVGLNGWKVGVPVEGRFDGKSFGFIAFPELAEIDVVRPDSYRPDELHVVRAPLTVSATSEPVDLQVTAVQLPTGMSMEPRTIHLAKGESRTVPVVLTLSRKSPSIWSTEMETPHDLTLEVKSSKRTSQVGFYVIVYPSHHIWTIDETVGSCDVVGTFIINGSGNFSFTGQAANNDILASRNVTFTGGFDGKQHFNMVLPVPKNDSAVKSYGFFRQFFKDNFTGLVQKPIGYRVRVQQGT